MLQPASGPITTDTRLGLEATLTAAWQRRGPLALLLLPAAGLFAILAALRRALYRTGLLAAQRLPVPVVVVGNITAGGSGKTPLVLHLARELKNARMRPGVVSRGHGGSSEGPCAVAPDADAAEVGDEPLLLAQRSGCPVWTGRDRVAAARALLAAHPECDVLLSDDGLQHYRLARDVEIVVIDRRGTGNGWLLPAGPLREAASRLQTVDAVVMNTVSELPEVACAPRRFRMTLAGARLHALADGKQSRDAETFCGQRVHAVAGIGDPQRFFDHLRALGLTVVEHAFPDHHAFRPEDLRFADGEAILMTEKDGVKCARFAPANTWVLPVDARLEPDLVRWLLEKIDGRPPA